MSATHSALPSPSRMFITFEGLDASGKSTHLKAAADLVAASGVEVIRTHEPGGTAIGNKIRSLFLDPAWSSVDGRVEALLLFASRRQHLNEVIDPALERGAWVFCDRFTDSTYAYQSAGRGLAREWINALDQLATDLRRPDRTLLFDLPAEMAQKRLLGGSRRRLGDLDRLDQETLDFYRSVRREYLAAAAREVDRFVVIDSSGEKNATWKQVASCLEKLLLGARVAG